MPQLTRPARKPMPKRNTHKISKRMVDALSARGKPGVYWDRDLPGFGVRLYTKTGARMVPLTPTALAVLDGIDRVSGNQWVFVGNNPASHVSNLSRHWHRLRVRAGLEDVRLHDLRHSYASRALALGESLSMIGKLLGHSKVETTARYAHLARDTEKVSAARVAGSIEANILPEMLRSEAAA